MTVVTGAYTVDPLPDNTRYRITWYRSRDEKFIFRGDDVQTGVGNNYSGLCIGWLGWMSRETGEAYGWEDIRENGYYYVDVEASGGESFTQRLHFAVKGIPVFMELSSPTPGGFDWKVALSEIFDTTNYIRAGICNQNFTNGQSSPPNGIVDLKNAHSSTISTVAEGTVTGQSPGTTYTLYGFAQAANGLYYRAGGPETITTEVQIPSHPVYISSRIEGGFNLYWGESYRAHSYVLYFKYSYESSWSYKIVYGTSTLIGGRDYGVQHDFEVAARAEAAGGGYYSSELTEITHGTTAPRTPTISNGGATSNSITINISGMQGNWDYVTVNRYTQGGEYIDSKNIPYGGTSVQWTGLPTGVMYGFDARSRLWANGVEIFSVNFSYTLIIATTGARPQNFAWDIPKVSMQTPRMSRNEWNNFTARINAFRTYKGLSTYSFTSAVVGNRLSANMFNQARNAISSMNTTGLPGQKVSLNNVRAGYLNDIVSCLNAIT